MEKPGRIVDREPEWERLVRMWASDAPELFLVRGRRRAGKSFLLTQFTRGAGGIYYQATRKTEREQLASLTRTVAAHFDDPALRRVSFESWEDVVRYCAARVEGGPIALVLDEFPYLADAAPALPSIIQSLWDQELRDTRIKLVLCGSHITVMKRLTEADQPLFGRRTGLLQVDPLGYRHAAAFAPGYSAADRIRVYGIFGGLPGHLELLDPTASLAENVARRIIDHTARLHEEAVHAFDAFVPDAEVHYSIIAAIANGEVRWHKISNRVGKKSASLSRPLTWLEEMEVVEHVAPITEYPDPSPKSMIYRLRDPYLAFWHRFVADLRARGVPSLLPAGEIWRSFIEPALDEYIGRDVFEDVCRQFVAHSRDPHLPFRPVQVGSWWSTDGQDEIDVVALGIEGELLVGECKWGRVGRDDLGRLEARADLLRAQLRTGRSVTLVLFARGPIDGAVQRRIDQDRILLFTPDDLFAASPEVGS